MVVANDIKCEAQQELRTVKRRLLEEEEKNARLQKELGDMQGHSRLVMSESEAPHSACFSLNHHVWSSCCFSVPVLNLCSFLGSR